MKVYVVRDGQPNEGDCCCELESSIVGVYTDKDRADLIASKLFEGKVDEIELDAKAFAESPEW